MWWRRFIALHHTLKTKTQVSQQHKPKLKTARLVWCRCFRVGSVNDLSRWETVQLRNQNLLDPDPPGSGVGPASGNQSINQCSICLIPVQTSVSVADPPIRTEPTPVPIRAHTRASGPGRTPVWCWWRCRERRRWSGPVGTPPGNEGWWAPPPDPP